jgi:hypothetical protein
VDRLADLLADEGNEGVDVTIAGRPGDRPMEKQIGLDAAILPALLAAHAVQRSLDGVKIIGCAARRGERGGFGLQDAAQLEELLHVALVFQRLAVDPDGCPLFRRHDKCAYALTRLDHAIGAKLRDRFPDNIAADAELVGELAFGGEPGSRDDVAALDLAAQMRSNAMRKRFHAADDGRTLLHAAFPYKSPEPGMRHAGLNRPAGSKAALIAV